MTTRYATAYIPRRSAEGVLHSVRFARDLGVPLNTHVTINIAQLGIGDRDAGRFFQDLRSRICRWWRYQRGTKGRAFGPIADAYSHANPRGSRHVHWIVHVPPGLSAEFAEVLRHRLCKIADLDDVGGALQIDPVLAPGSLAKYVLRGVQPAYAAYLHITPCDEGMVIGRRTGTSRAIGREARRRANWSREVGRAKGLESA